MPIPRFMAKEGLGWRHVIIISYFDRFPERAVTINDILLAMYPDPSEPGVDIVEREQLLANIRARLDAIDKRNREAFRMAMAAEDLVRRGSLEVRTIDSTSHYFLSDEALAEGVRVHADSLVQKLPS